MLAEQKRLADEQARLKAQAEKAAALAEEKRLADEAELMRLAQVKETQRLA